MVSEADIAEARRKALRNGEEDPITIAQRYLNIYRQLHIFPPERKESFDQSLLNLSPITISIISSLPGGLTFQDYIDEVFTNMGREKTARNEGSGEFDSIQPSDVASAQPQILSNAQASVQAQQVPPQVQVMPQMVGAPATLAMDSNFAGEFAKIMGGILEQQTNIQKAGLEKVAQDIGKTQLFIAKKLEDSKAQQHIEISNLCKTIAQSHTALSSSLATLGQNIVLKTSEMNALSNHSVGRSVEDDARLVNMINQSQERLMMGILSRLPQAVGVGNVNVNAPSRSAEDDARLAELIARSQEKVVSTVVEMLSSSHNQSQQNSTNVEMLISAMSQSQDRLISALVEKLPQASNSQGLSSANRTVEDDERLASLIAKSQEKLISALVDKIPQPKGKERFFKTSSSRSEEDDERLVKLLVASQENMIKSLMDKNILSQQVSRTERNDNYEQPKTETLDSVIDQTYNDIDFSMFTPVEQDPVYEDNSSVDTILAEENQQIIETSDLEKKKKKKKKKKKSNKETEEFETFETDNNEGFDNSGEELSYLDDIKEEISENVVQIPEANDIVESYDQSKIAEINNVNIAESYEPNEITPPIKDIEIPNDEEPLLLDTIVQENQASETVNNEPLSSDIGISEDEEDELLLNKDPWLDDEELTENSDNELTSLNWDFDDSTKQDWGFESKDDSWGISVTDKEPDDTTSETEDGEWVYVDEYGNEYPADDDADGYPQNNNDNQDWEWDYVEEINGNTCAYSSDSYDKKLSMDEISPIYKGSNIQMTTVPQIYDETNDDEMNDPYKNSILKD